MLYKRPEMFDDNAKTCFNVVFFYSSSLDFFLHFD